MTGPIEQPAQLPGSLLLSEIEAAERDALKDLASVLSRAPELVQRADREGETGLRVRARRALGQAMAYANRYEESLTVLREAEQLGADADPVQGAMACNTSVHPLCRLGRFDEAVLAGTRAHDVFTRHGRPELAARADVNTAVALRMADRPADAITLLDRALPNFASQPTVRAQVESNRAEALLDVCRFDEAEASFRRAFAAFEAAGVRRAAAIVRGNLADLAGRQGRLHEAVEGFELARQALDDAGAPGDAARLEVEQADALASLGMHGAAAAGYEHALPALESAGLAAEAARAHLGLGRSLLRLGRMSLATEQSRHAERGFEALNHETGVGRARLQLAEAALQAGDVAGADRILRSALPGLSERPSERCAALVLQSVALRGLGHPAGAEAAAQDALRIARERGLPQRIADGLLVLAAARTAAGRPPDAMAALREAMTQVEGLRGTLRGGHFRAAFLGDRERVFADAAEVALDIAAASDAPTRHIDEAFACIERSRSRTLLDTLLGGEDERARPGEPAPGPASAMEADLRSERAALNGLYDQLDRCDTRTSPERLTEWRSRIVAAERSIDTLERRIASVLSDRATLADAADASAVGRALPSGHRLVSFATAGGQLNAFVVTPGSDVRVFRGIASMVELESALGELGFQVARAIARGLPAGEVGARSGAATQAALARLGTLLLRPLAGALAGARGLVMAPTGSLFGVPFPSVAAAEGMELPVTMVPSASVYAQLRRSAGRGPTPAGPALLVGVSDEAAPHAEAECAAIAEHLPGARLLLGEGATRRSFLDACEGASVVHLATHARFLAGEPQASGIRFADGWLTVRDLAGVSLRGATVVLSACDAGRVGRGAGDEILGLSRALFVAGAYRMVMSLWPLHDQSAGIFMDELYRAWYVEGSASRARTLAAAMVVAREALRSRVAHPAAWAPSVCFGLD